MTRTEWQECRRSPGRVLGVLALGVLGLTACESYFVDPHPPELEQLKREQVLGAQDAPLVYGLLFDLNIPDATECTRVRNHLRNTLRAALLPSGRTGMELSPQDLSPNCQQSTNRQLNLNAHGAEVNTAVQRYGTARVKPVMFYFNNVNLPLPPILQSQLGAMRSWSTGPALLWSLATPEAQQGLGADFAALWTFSTDPRLTAGLEEAARNQLPLVQLEQPSETGYPLFSSQELASVREFKGCAAPSVLSGIDFVYGKQAVKVEPTKPPRIRLTLTVPSAPVSRTQKPPSQTLRYTLEVCRANCDRLYPLPPDGEPRVWNQTPGCMLTESGS